MLTLRSIGIAIVICSLCMFTMANTSEAIEIVEFRSYNDTHEEYDLGYPYFTFYVETDEPYDRLNWAVYHVDTGETQWEVGSTEGDGVSTHHYFSISGLLSGEPKGKKYVIGVTAYKTERIDGRDWISFATDTCNLRVFKVTTAWNNGTGRNTGASGYATIYRHYHNGENIVMDSSAYAYNPRNNPKAKNPNDNPLRVDPWFRVIEYKKGPNGEAGNAIQPEHGRDEKDSETVEVGNGSQRYSPDNMIVGVHLGRWIREEETLFYDAHTHLQVSTTKGLQ